MTDLRLSYQTVEFGKTDVHICTLRDSQEFSDPKGAAERLGICSASWSLFGVVWPSSLVLAHYMYDYHVESKRVLEVGCGIALSSLLLNKQLTDITATDYHPEAETFLERNTQLNGDRGIAFECVNWADKEDKLGQFDLIIGSDILYEDSHIELLANFIQNHAKSTCEVIIVDPGRGRKNKFSFQMINFGFTSLHLKPIHTDYLDKEFKGHILKFQRNA
jgi:predicted nicotinamide N-methyase